MIPFNKPFMTGKELWNIAQAHTKGHLSGDGGYTKLCHGWLEQQLGCDKALLTHSCTAGLEMAALLAELQPGDEVIMPSYTFVSTANAFVLRGGGASVRRHPAPTRRTLTSASSRRRSHRAPSAIVVVHYAGVVLRDGHDHGHRKAVTTCSSSRTRRRA